MTQHEFTLLRQSELARRKHRSFAFQGRSRRSSKHPSVGQVYRDSRVVSEVGLEIVFNKPGWTKIAATK